MILIYSNRTTSRLEYTLDFVFKIRGIAYKITNHKASFEEFDGIKLNYSDQLFSNTITVTPISLLFTEDIPSFELSKKLFYKTQCLSFNEVTDPFASIFFVLTRMEEYHSKKTDNLGRFEGKNSIQYQFGWLEQVVCDHWSVDIIDFLNAQNNVELEIPKEETKIIPTFDIDNAFAYKHKGLVRSFFSNFKDFFLGRSKRLLERQRVQAGLLKDPYDTYDKLIALTDKNISFKMFWLLGDFAKFDRNISHRTSKHKKLIQRMSRYCDIGIHPSVKSNSYDFFLHNEIERLERILNRKVVESRQHFLILKFPYTYQTLINQEITDDYTMCFADLIGFRAGTARSFNWFDLSRNEVSNLVIHPIAFMDGTLNEYMKLSPEDAKKKIEALFLEVKEFGGDFCFIWHNETIGNYGIWKGWSEVFDYSISLCKTMK